MINKTVLFILFFSFFLFGNNKYQLENCTIETLSNLTKNDLFLLNKTINNSISDIKKEFKLFISSERINIFISKNFLDFNMQTGLKNYFFGVNINNKIYLQSINTLISKNVFQTTLRHEIFHLILKRNNCIIPDWLEETLAVGFSGSIVNYETNKKHFNKKYSELLNLKQKSDNLNSYNSKYYFYSLNYIFLFKYLKPDFNLKSLCNQIKESIFNILFEKELSQIEIEWKKFIKITKL